MASSRLSMFTTVTVAIDQSPSADRAISPAVRLAHALGATVELISLVAPGASWTSERASLDERAAALGDVPSRVRIIESLAFGPTLADWSARDGLLLCLSTRGRSALGKAVFGSVAAEVAHAAMTPFVMVGPDVNIDVGDPFSSIIGCVDGSEPMTVMADTIVALRSALDASVYLVTVDQPGPISVLPGPKAFDPVDRAFAALSDRGCHAHRGVLEEQDVAGSIASFASIQSTPLLVVGTRQRGKLTRVALHSGALEIVQRSPYRSSSCRSDEPPDGGTPHDGIVRSITPRHEVRSGTARSSACAAGLPRRVFELSQDCFGVWWRAA